MQVSKNIFTRKIIQHILVFTVSFIQYNLNSYYCRSIPYLLEIIGDSRRRRLRHQGESRREPVQDPPGPQHRGGRPRQLGLSVGQLRHALYAQQRSECLNQCISQVL